MASAAEVDVLQQLERNSISKSHTRRLASINPRPRGSSRPSHQNDALQLCCIFSLPAFVVRLPPAKVTASVERHHSLALLCHFGAFPFVSCPLRGEGAHLTSLLSSLSFQFFIVASTHVQDLTLGRLSPGAYVVYRWAGVLKGALWSSYRRDTMT